MKLLLQVYFLIIYCNLFYHVNTSEFDKILVVNESCPQFVTMSIEKRGLGDQLNKLFGLLSIAYQSKVTIVVDDIFGSSAEHSETGHMDKFQHLGLPKFQTLSEIKSKYTLKNYGLEFDDILFQQDIFNDLPCNSLMTISNFIYCSAGKTYVAWCGSTVGSLIQSIIRPLLDETVDNRYYKNNPNAIKVSNNIKWNTPSYLPLKENVTNIVWHIRVGDICLHCDEIHTFQNISLFIQKHFDEIKLPYQNIVVHLEDKKVYKLFENIPNVIHYTNSNTSNVIDLFLNADILIATGSSFISTISMMTKLHRPLVIQMIAKEAVVGLYYHYCCYYYIYI